MKKYKSFILTIILVIIDLTVKLIIKNTMIPNQSITIINNFFYITYVKNTGAAWSILSGRKIFLIIFSLIVIISIIYYIIKRKEYNKLELIGYSMVLSGAIGNLIDRIIYGYVIDYLDFYIFNYDYPIFNIADILIVIGIIIIFISYGGKNEKKK